MASGVTQTPDAELIGVTSGADRSYLLTSRERSYDALPPIPLRHAIPAMTDRSEDKRQAHPKNSGASSWVIFLDFAEASRPRPSAPSCSFP